MVYRIFAEKKPGLSPEAAGLLEDLRAFLGIEGLTGLRILNRYDVEGIDETVFAQARDVVFSEPPVDATYLETFPVPAGPHRLLAVEALPGQFDQRADSCAQCISLLAGGERPAVAYARVYVLEGELTDEALERIRRYLINPVESREAAMEKPATLARSHPAPADVPAVAGFTSLDGGALAALGERMGLAMDADDLRFLQAYFRDEEGRDPTVTEIRVVDTYWSDHCRHTTFSTHLEQVDIEDDRVAAAYGRYLDARREIYGAAAESRPRTLMDAATIGAKVLKKRGLLPELDESEEINACSIHVPAEVDGRTEDWLLLFKNETHNHPTEIEPFGGAATCIGGCIRDPLSGRAYVHQAMRVTGGGDPRAPFSETLPGKLPQRKLALGAAAGYSSYGNQIGLATGHVAEVYHPGYLAKRLECGAVVGAAPAGHVRRETPAPGDVVILLGGRTGRDGIGGATGSSKTHNLQSLSTMASEVQKGNAPEERKLQRLFRNGAVTRRIKRCNDFGAGGVAVAVGELADGLAIDLDAVRKKYEGLDGTELAISESQERMAVVVAPADAEPFIAAARAENLEAYPVATVTAAPRMVMTWRGQTVANLSRAFLNTNGAVKHADARVPAADRTALEGPRFSSLEELAGSLRCASRRGLVERFDGSIGAGSLLMPYGGRRQRTPAQAMAALFPVEPGQTTAQASVMAWGFDPERMEKDPYGGARESVYTAMAKVVAAGGDYRKAYLTLQEYFERLRNEPARWGKPLAALLGALDAQLELGAAAIGGKDSMSGSFLDRDVPPTLIAFAIAPLLAGEVLSPEFKGPGHPVCAFSPDQWDAFHGLCRAGKVLAAWAVDACPAEGVMNMAFGNGVGFRAEGDFDWYRAMPGWILAELTERPAEARLLGCTTAEPVLALGAETAAVDDLLARNEAVLAAVYPTEAPAAGAAEPYTWTDGCAAVCGHRSARPRVVIPVFPGTNCEYDSARACLAAGLEPEILVVRNLGPEDLEDSARALEAAIRGAQILFLPGGFSGGDEPEGSAKFIASFLRSPRLREAVADLLERRDGLMLGICNGFQALVKLGLVPYGVIRPMDDGCPTLTYNTIGRHQSSIVRTRVCSNKSPWLLEAPVGAVYEVPISHGEGRFLAPPAVLADLAAKGQIATQYVDAAGNPSMETTWNPNGSLGAVEGIISPDGRVLGKMGHSERVGPHLYRNVPGSYDMGLFRSAARYFR